MTCNVMCKIAEVIDLHSVYWYRPLLFVLFRGYSRLGELSRLLSKPRRTRASNESVQSATSMATMFLARSKRLGSYCIGVCFVALVAGLV